MRQARAGSSDLSGCQAPPPTDSSRRQETPLKQVVTSSEAELRPLLSATGSLTESRLLSDGEMVQQHLQTGELEYIVCALALLTYFACQLSQNILPVATVGMSFSNVLVHGLLDLGAEQPIGSCPVDEEGRRSRMLGLDLNSIWALLVDVKGRMRANKLVDLTLLEKALLLTAGPLGALLGASWPLAATVRRIKARDRILLGLVGVFGRALFMPMAIERQWAWPALVGELLGSLLVQGALWPLVWQLAQRLSRGRLGAANESCALMEVLAMPMGALICAQLLSLGLDWTWCIRWPALLAGPLLLAWLCLGDLAMLEAQQDPQAAGRGWLGFVASFSSRWNLKLLALLPTFATELLHLNALDLSLVASLQAASTIVFFLVQVSVIGGNRRQLEQPSGGLELVRELSSSLLVLVAHLLLSLLDCDRSAFLGAAILLPGAADFRRAGQPQVADIVAVPAAALALSRLPGSGQRVAWAGIWLSGAALRSLGCLAAVCRLRRDL